MYIQRLAGRSARLLATEHAISVRQVHDIVRACREADIKVLALDAPWRAQQFAEEELLRLDQAINDELEIETLAREQNNYSTALGAAKQRTKLMSERMKLLQDLGWMTGPGGLQLKTEAANLVGVIAKVSREYDMPKAARAAFIDALASAARPEDPSFPAHWMPSKEAIDASTLEERDATERAKAQSELIRAGIERRDAERSHQRWRRQDAESKRRADEDNERSKQPESGHSVTASALPGDGQTWNGPPGVPASLIFGGEWGWDDPEDE